MDGPSPATTTPHEPPQPLPVSDDSPPWSVATKSIVAIAGLILMVAIVRRFSELLQPIIVAAILAYLLSPFIGWLMRHINIGRGLATLIVYLTGLALLLVAGSVLGIVAYEQLLRLANLLPRSVGGFVDLAQAQVDLLVARVNSLVGYDLRGLVQTVDLQALLQQGVALIQATLRQGGSWAATLAQTTVNTVTTGLLIFFISFYIAKDSPQFSEMVRATAQQPGYRRDADRLMSEFQRIWDAYLRGQVILGLVIGAAVSLSLAALGVNNALGLGVLSGVLEFLPVIGPVIGAVAAVLVALFQPDNYLGLAPLYYAAAVLGVMIVIQQLENNFLVPRIVGGALDLHPLVVMISVIMGASLAGILGAVLAAPVVATMKLLGSYAWRKLLDLPPFPATQNHQQKFEPQSLKRSPEPTDSGLRTQD